MKQVERKLSSLQKAIAQLQKTNEKVMGVMVKQDNSKKEDREGS